MRHVLVTGMSGLIGGAVRRRLEGRCELNALNRRAVEGVRTFQADIGDLDAILPAFEGQDTVVHLAGYRGVDWPQVLHANVIGTYNVFEASRRAGVRRVIYASSGATISGWQKDEPYRAILEGRYQDVPPAWPMLTHETPIRSWSLYGAAKVWGEALAYNFTQISELSILCLRFGLVNEEDRPASSEEAPVWCGQRDAAQAVERSIEAPPELRFEVFHVVSRCRWGFRDISHAKRVVGYEPEDSADEYVW